MSQSLQAQFGYNPEKIRKAKEERIARAKADQEEKLARARAAQYNAIKRHGYYIRPINEFGFPKTEKAQTACKEIVSELKGINKALELGLSYAKFSDLLTEKALSVEKIKDLRGEGIPRDFLVRVDDCVDAFKESRDWWHKQIENAEYPDLKPYEDYVMREYWSEASVHLTYCIGIAESNTNVNSTAIDQIALMIRTEQIAVKTGVLEAKDYFDPTVANLSVDAISARLSTYLSVTNTPSVGSQQ